MPDMIPKLMLDDKSVRDDYRAGIWDYARGRPATDHERYSEACQIAVCGKNRIAFDPGWIRTWQDVEAVIEGCWFDEDAGLHYVGLIESHFINYCGEFEGDPFILLDWQKYDIVMPLFGWKQLNRKPRVGGRWREVVRRYRWYHVWIPKKNGKTTLCAIILLVLLAFDGEAAAQVYSGAVTRDQAAMIFDTMKGFISMNSSLDDIFKIQETHKKIAFPRTNSYYRALCSEAGSSEGSNQGQNIQACCYDEIHAFNNDRLFRSTSKGGAARDQYLFGSISTAGEWNENSVGVQKWNFSKQIAEGTISDSSTLVYIAAAKTPTDEQAGDDWEDPEIWKKSNPSWGWTVHEQFYVDEKKKCIDDESIADFRRYYLNIWTHGVQSYLPMEAWKKKCGGAFDIEESALVNVGIDLAEKDDTSAVAFLHGPDMSGYYKVEMKMYLPENNIKVLEKKHGAKYRLWAKRGWYTLTPGDMVDFQYLVDDIVAYKHEIVSVGRDPHKSRFVDDALLDAGFEVVDVQQTFQGVGPATMELKNLIAGGKIKHGDNQPLTWMAGNLVVIKSSGGDIPRPNKLKSKSKIDGPVAIIIAMSVSILDNNDKYIFTGF